MIEAVLSISGMALAAGIGLGFAAKKFHVEGDPLADKLEESLPGTNCGNCGYPGCRPYAEALAIEDTNVEINLCSPGGAEAMEAVAVILGIEPVAMGDIRPPGKAVIDEVKCIGCTACIKACPVDAIVGANKQSHTVIADWCTDCAACLEPCPVDCITMVPVVETISNWKVQKPAGPYAVH